MMARAAACYIVGRCWKHLRFSGWPPRQRGFVTSRTQSFKGRDAQSGNACGVAESTFPTSRPPAALGKVAAGVSSSSFRSLRP